MYLQDGETPLYIASRKGHGAVVKLLLQGHADASICMKVISSIDPPCVSMTLRYYSRMAGLL
jgi:hypothetical protein